MITSDFNVHCETKKLHHFIFAITLGPVTLGPIIGSHDLYGNLRTQDQFSLSSTTCHCVCTYATVLRLVVRLVARLVVLSRFTYDCVRSIVRSIVVDHMSKPVMRLVGRQY